MGFEPSDLPSLAFWVDAERAQFNPLASDETIYSVDNRGFCGFNFDSGNTNDPRVKYCAELGRPGIHCENAENSDLRALSHGNAEYNGIADTAGVGHASVFLMAAPDHINFSEAGVLQPMMSRAYSHAAAFAFHLGWEGSDPMEIVTSNAWPTGGTFSGDGALPDTDMHLYELAYADVPSAEAWVDGVSIGTNTQTLSWGMVDNVYLLRDYAGNWFDGQVNDIMYFNKVLDPHERLAVRAWFARKYNHHIGLAV